MEPLRLHITEFIPRASELPQPLAAFVTGESVQATVMELLDDGRMVVFIKGMRLKASAQTGALRIGQVLQARVERSDGQILLRLDPLPGRSSGRQASHASPVVQLLRTLLPADESFEKSFQRLLKTVREAVKDQILPEQSGEALEQLVLKLLLDAAQADGPRLKEAVMAKGLQYERAQLPSPEPEADGARNPDAPRLTLKGWLLATLKAHAQGAYDEMAPAQTLAWVKDAQQMLKVIEREQVLNALNVQHGLPLMLTVPLMAGPVASLFLYVVQPDGEGAGEKPRPSAKPYSLVTLLELDGIGSIRVDALLTGTRLAARLMVERPEIDQAIARLLPVLREGLTSQGYQVEGLSSIVADPALVRGDDLPVATAAARNLLNLKI